MTALDLPRRHVPPVRTGPRLDPDAPGRIPTAIGVALFLALFGSLMQVPYMWQAQILLVPATVGLFVIVGVRTKPLREIKIDPWLFPILVWVLMSIGWTTGNLSASVQEVANGSRLVNDAGTTMTDIVTSVQRVTDIMAEISASTSEQSTSIAEVGQAVSQLDQMTQQNAALVEESAAAAQSLKDQSVRLTEVVGSFRLAA